MVYASMGIYVFNREILEEEVTEDAKKNSEHDFGKNIMTQMIDKKRQVVIYNLKENGMENNPYWKDVGTIEAYYEANMDLVQVSPEFNLYDKEWPIRTYQEQHPPAKTVHSGEEIISRVGLVLDSIISSGCVVSGGKIQRSILSPNVRINSFSQVYDSILFEGVNVGRYSMIKKAIIDKDVNIPEKTVIGYDKEDDQKRFFVTESGITIVPKGTKI
jgi:glucose-1-phosphate adenylyltransferase